MSDEQPSELKKRGLELAAEIAAAELRRQAAAVKAKYGRVDPDAGKKTVTASDAMNPGPGPDGGGAGDEDEKRKPSVAKVLTEIGLRCVLFHDPAGIAYATVNRRTMAVRSKLFRLHLTNVFRRETGSVPNGEAMANAISAIEAAAVYDGPKQETSLRIANHGGRVYLYLGDESDTVIEVDGDGWRPCDDPPVRFRRIASQKPLPMPVRGGRVDLLRQFVTVDDDNFALLVAYMTACFRVGAPTPHIALSGEAGTGKSTTSRVIKRTLDPTAGELRSAPKDEVDVMVGAKNSHVLAYDNLGAMPAWLSDSLCRLATGGGIGKRELYTDGEEVIFEALRPVILTSIEDIATAGDLLERCILLRLQPIPTDRKESEETFWPRFDEALPAILGALLDRVSGGLRCLPTVKVAKLPRMADFAKWSVACETGAGEPARFLTAYADNQAGAHEQALDGSSVAEALVRMMAGMDRWTGTATDLFKQLCGLLPENKPKDFPRAANSLSGRLKQLAPNLRAIHQINVDTGKAKKRSITITRAVEVRERSSASSASSTGFRSPGSAGIYADSPGDDPADDADDPADDRPQYRRHETVKNAGKIAPGDDADDADDLSRTTAGAPPSKSPYRIQDLGGIAN